MRRKDRRIRSLGSLFPQRKVPLIHDIFVEQPLSTSTPCRQNSLAGITCMAHPPVTQPGPADGLAIWLNTQESDDTPKQSQGRVILETLDPMPAFTNRARKRAIALRKHPSGKLHLIITGNCVIKLESRTSYKNVQLWSSAICRRLQVAFGGSLWTPFQCHLLF